MLNVVEYFNDSSVYLHLYAIIYSFNVCVYSMPLNNIKQIKNEIKRLEIYISITHTVFFSL